MAVVALDRLFQNRQGLVAYRYWRPKERLSCRTHNVSRDVDHCRPCAADRHSAWCRCMNSSAASLNVRDRICVAARSARSLWRCCSGSMPSASCWLIRLIARTGLFKIERPRTTQAQPMSFEIQFVAARPTRGALAVDDEVKPHAVEISAGFTAR